MKVAKITFSTEPEIKEEFDRIAKEQGLNKSQWFENMMLQYINKYKERSKNDTQDT